MSNPAKRDIAQAILDLTKTVPQPKLAKGVAAYLSSERRTNEIDAIMREVKRLRTAKTGLVEVDIITAFPASSKTKQQIEKMIASPVVMNEIIDKQVIGGVRVETNDMYLDLTVRNRLNKMKTGATS